MQPPTLARATFEFLRIGNLTFGGGEPTMAAIYQEFVARRGWLGRGDYGLVYSLARITPGTNLLAFCAGVGWRLAGTPGSVLAVAAVTIPSAALTTWMTYAYAVLDRHPQAGAAIQGALAGAAGMMAAAVWLLIRPSFKPGYRVQPVLFPVVAFALAILNRVDPLLILAAGAIAGAAWRERESA
jgi:chromate transporter